MEKAKECYCDNFFAVTEKEEGITEFLDFLNEREATRASLTVEQGKMSILTCQDLEVQEEVKEYLLRDTEENTGLFVSVNDEIYPIRDTAFRALLELSGVSGSFLKKLSNEDIAEIINKYCFKKNPFKKVSLKIEDEKVTGWCGANTYAEIPSTKVFSDAKSFFEKEFPKASFKKGSFTHAITEAAWDMKEHASDFVAVLKGVSLIPEFNLSTSDCGLSSIVFRPYLKDAAKLKMPLEPIKVLHKGKGKEDDLKAAFEQAYAVVDSGVDLFHEMSEQSIAHPKTTLLRVAKAHKLPKKAVLENAEIFEAIFGGGTCTALDIFRSLCETLQTLPSTASAEERFLAEDNLARVGKCNWKKFDLPGAFSW